MAWKTVGEGVSQNPPPGGGPKRMAWKTVGEGVLRVYRHEASITALAIPFPNAHFGSD